MKLLEFPIKHTIFNICLLFGSSACAVTFVSGGQIPKQVLQLAESNTSQIGITANNFSKQEDIGHQYLFFLFPMGKIKIQNPVLMFSNKVYERLAVYGYKPSLSRIQGAPNVKIDLVKIQLSAYDLLFTRKIYCNMKIEIEAYDEAGNLRAAGSGIARESLYKSMAFKRELEYLLNKCLEQSVNKALSSVGIRSRH